MQQPVRAMGRQLVGSVVAAILIAAAAFAVSLCCFAPRFVLWNGLYLPPAQNPPEVNRAVDVLAQLRHPFVQVANPNNVVIQWRLLFPLIGHGLHLSDRAFLSIPLLGCWLTLTYVALVARRYVGSGFTVLSITTAMATASWFFVSTGWLSYEDSWYVLGVLLVSFARGRGVLAAACVLMPFVDERFVLTMPLALAVRLCALPMPVDARRRCRRDALLVATVLIPYVALRGVLFSHDAGSRHFLAGRAAELHVPTPWTQYLLGGWMGLRLLWAGVIAAVLLTFRRHRRGDAACVAAAVAFSTALSLVIAADLSRSMSMLIPVALLGVCLLAAEFPLARRYGLPALALGNLLLPATHVLTGFNEPIHSLPIVLDEFSHPPPEVNAKIYLANAKLLIRDGNDAAALRVLGWTMRLDSSSSEAKMLRADLLQRQHQR